MWTLPCDHAFSKHYGVWVVPSPGWVPEREVWLGHTSFMLRWMNSLFFVPRAWNIPDGKDTRKVSLWRRSFNRLSYFPMAKGPSERLVEKPLQPLLRGEHLLGRRPDSGPLSGVSLNGGSLWNSCDGRSRWPEHWGVGLFIYCMWASRPARGPETSPLS